MGESSSIHPRCIQKNHTGLKKLSIGILGTRGIPNNYGGFEQFAQHLAPGLVQRGHSVYVYNSHHHPYKEKEWKGVQLISCRDPQPSIGTAGQFLYDKNCLRDARRRNYDVLLHLGYSSDAIWHRKWPADTFNIVNMDGLEWKRSKYNAITRRFLRWSESMAAKHAELLIADSPGIRDHLYQAYHKQAVYIPYGASIFNDPDPAIPNTYGLMPGQYYLLIARMEPENNIEMIIRGWLLSGKKFPLLIIGNISNRYGRYITRNYIHPAIKYFEPIYEPHILNNLRYHSGLYFHGHSVGGTNPSLLEAMACGCRIAAHDNVFNKAVLDTGADYFSSAGQISEIINAPTGQLVVENRKQHNLEKLRTVYDHEKVIDAYEEVMLKAVR